MTAAAQLTAGEILALYVLRSTSDYLTTEQVMAATALRSKNNVATKLRTLVLLGFAEEMLRGRVTFYRAANLENAQDGTSQSISGDNICA